MENRCNGHMHKVVAGDTMYKLAKMYGVRLIDILKENPYVNVYNLQIGDEVCIPLGIYDKDDRKYYTAKPGDDIGKVLSTLGISVEELFKYNNELYDLVVPEKTIIRIPPEKK